MYIFLGLKKVQIKDLMRDLDPSFSSLCCFNDCKDIIDKFGLKALHINTEHIQPHCYEGTTSKEMLAWFNGFLHTYIEFFNMYMNLIYTTLSDQRFGICLGGNCQRRSSVSNWSKFQMSSRTGLVSCF